MPRINEELVIEDFFLFKSPEEVKQMFSKISLVMRLRKLSEDKPKRGRKPKAKDDKQERIPNV
jgi:hypothetical protein